MRRVVIVVATVLVAAGACVALIALLASRDSGQVAESSGPGVLEPERTSDAPAPPEDPPTSGPHRPEPVERDAAELTQDQLLEALSQGNVVIAYDAAEPPAELVTLQEEVAGPFDPQLAAAGQAVILARRPGVGGIVALAWRRKLEASGPDDPALREFTEAYLGQARP